jgi:uncharacterized protein (TIGR00297 family)
VLDRLTALSPMTHVTATMLLNVLVGALFAGTVALIALRAHALTRGGAIAAFAVGTLTYASGTIGFTLVLLAFFVPSVILSRLGKARKRELVDIGKGGARDALQVLANGGVATVCAVAWAFTHDLRLALAFVGAYAASTADTWATEIGTLARRPPRSILTFRPVSTGMSGGITLPGTLAEAGGALWIGAVALPAIMLAYVCGHIFPFAWPVVFAHWSRVVALFAVVSVAGIIGGTVDSLLGATLQELRHCDTCDRTCETDPHACGNPTTLIRGLPGVSNDAVNFVATLTGTVTAPLLYVALLFALT